MKQDFPEREFPRILLVFMFLFLSAAAIFPQRVVSLAPGITEIVFALNRGNTLVGVTKFCDYPAAAKRIQPVGGFLDVNIEAVVALNPDIVIIYPEHRDKVNFLRPKTRIVMVRHGRLADLLLSIQAIAKVLGAEAEGKRLVAGIQEKLQRILARGLGKRKIRTLFVAGRNVDELKNMYIIGKNDFINDLLEIAGGTNAYEGNVNYPSISMESVIFLNPEFIFEISSHYEGIADKQILALWRPYRMIGAVKRNRIEIIKKTYWLRPGPRVASIAEELAEFFQQRLKNQRAVMIKATNLGYAAGGKNILQQLDFSIQENDFVLIFGQNGAGKSTLLKILAGIIPAGCGEVLVMGKKIAQLSKRELATKLSFLPQSDDFCLPLLVKDVLLSGRYPYRSLFRDFSKKDFELYQEAVERFALADLVYRNIQTLSGGERKKVLLATAFIQDVPLILLDEPLNFLDPASAFQMIKMLENFHRKGKTILIVSHLIEYFFPHANKILALKEGKIRYFGAKQFSPALFRDIYNVSFKHIFLENKEIIYADE